MNVFVEKQSFLKRFFKQ